MRARPGARALPTLEHFVLRSEARKLYREVLRALRGVDPDAAAGVRLAAREQFAAHADESDVDRIRVLVGDEVLVEMTPYDLTKGRITYRFK